MINVFIIGSKGIPAKYGGFETFVDKLTENKVNKDIKYHIACLSDNDKDFKYNESRCFNVPVKNIGAAKAVFYDLKALKMSIDYIKKNNINNCIIYILACRIGPFIGHYKKQLDGLGIKLYINPDGHEWKRSKWNRFIKAYWKYSEKLMVKHADLLICDSIGIETYINKEYKGYNPETKFIAYGADIEKSNLKNDSPKLLEWYKKFDIKNNGYYLIVGRFVPENNYETMLKEFIKSNTKKDLVIITNVEHNKFYNYLQGKTFFENDKRIKFVGTVYDKELLKKIRENSFAYIHGHEVGGTNPSLLEALASTKINLLYDVNFNKEVALDGALYFNKCDGNLSKLIQYVETMNKEEINNLEGKAKQRIKDNYSWSKIVDDYEKLFLNN